FLAVREQAVSELLVDLQHLDEVLQSAVSDGQLAVESVCPRIRFGADFADGRQVDRAGQLGYVLRLRVGLSKGTDADAVLFGKNNPVYQNVLVASVVDVFEIVAALRAQLAFDV